MKKFEDYSEGFQMGVIAAISVVIMFVLIGVGIYNIPSADPPWTPQQVIEFLTLQIPEQ